MILKVEDDGGETLDLICQNNMHMVYITYMLSHSLYQDLALNYS